ncbi:MAG: flagellar biosynthesis protein FlhA [Acidobacteria bacterium]|nr:MAG: flagellar biosynthesis protein FlhA [Acidobacteriota bacterium]
MSTALAQPAPVAARAHASLPLAMILTLALIVVPLPSALLDVLITLNLSTSIVVLLVAMYVPGPTQFSAFPSLLLLMTLFRLALNVASTRLILTRGDSGTSAAGVVIQAFGNFVVGGSFVVGAVIFIVILVIQFVVIAHGSTRISEVIARFTLDAMPGKQMAIDADLNAGLITEREAIERRAMIQREAEFFGSMDGAVRFTQRDAIASLLITLVNIGAGLLIGVLQHGMTAAEAVRTYSVLTIGDGLVTAVPALLVAVAGGIITTRAAQERNLGEEVIGQILLNPQPLRIASGTLLALALVPGLPKVAFLLLSAAVFGASRAAEASRRAREEAPPAAETQPPDVEDDVEPLLGVDPMCIEIGYDLIAAVGADRPGGILDKIKGLRRQIASERGFVLPPVRVRDNLRLPPDRYVILLRGVKVAEGTIPKGRLLALEAGVTRRIEGEPTRDPAFGLPAVWITADRADEARAAGYTVVDPPAVLSTHLMEVINRNAAELLGREDVARLLDHLQKTHPKAVAELVPERMTVGEVHRVLQGLLREGVSIRDLPLIVETLADAAAGTRDTQALVEACRRALARSITEPLLDGDGVLKAVALSPELEEELTQGLVPGQDNTPPQPLDPRRARDIVGRILTAVAGAGGNAAIVVGPQLRPFLAALIRPQLPHTPVLSTLEVPPEVTLRAVATVS